MDDCHTDGKTTYLLPTHKIFIYFCYWKKGESKGHDENIPPRFPNRCSLYQFVLLVTETNLGVWIVTILNLVFLSDL